MSSASKKRKIAHERRVFQEKWEVIIFLHKSYFLLTNKALSSISDSSDKI